MSSSTFNGLYFLKYFADTMDKKDLNKIEFAIKSTPDMALFKRVALLTTYDLLCNLVNNLGVQFKGVSEVIDRIACYAL